MDSMRSLNSSLPRSSSIRRSNPPPEHLIQSFKTAALSVTNLYKTAAADQIRARELGYQDALDDLLVFLDKENLGLTTGKGGRFESGLLNGWMAVLWAIPQVIAMKIEGRLQGGLGAVPL